MSQLAYPTELPSQLYVHFVPFLVRGKNRPAVKNLLTIFITIWYFLFYHLKKLVLIIVVA